MEGCVNMGYSFVNAVELSCNIASEGFTAGKKYAGYIRENLFETTDDKGVYREVELSNFGSV